VSDPDSSFADPGASADNAHPYSVSELAFSLKRTLEDAYGFVRLRGEISKVTRHASGHVYLTLKDERASLDAVVWKMTVRALACTPETGLEVIVTGRITTYPARSSYQLVVETMAPAGVGALLAQLERLKARLQAEGLFDPTRKVPLPRTPAVIGVITSPTGAVIRDILHRLRERWPVHVVLWPVTVQGTDAAAQVAAAILGFNGLAPDGPAPRPDVLIVARGGGSVEDLWPFNDEALVRAAAASQIPLISAVGHETDTTLIDFAADRRAPTPTAAAEMATPVLAELALQTLSLEQRLVRALSQGVELRRGRLAAAARGLGRPGDTIGLASQRFDLAASRLGSALQRCVAAHDRDLARASARLSAAPLVRTAQALSARVDELDARLLQATQRRIDDLARRTTNLDQLRRSFDPNGPLGRGFVRVHRAEGALVRSASDLQPQERVRLIFADGERRAVIEPKAGQETLRLKSGPKAKPARAPAGAGPAKAQDDLFDEA